ncbi:hypothetical protein HK100_010950 [Physocladia obscura]|uniref:WLM domain-containing protein n=1 Tax=Physocladia obscura TaxID=109957 RepID=A0AAD5T3U5_9FUNG|nr:hypothetical protein HK100_010950 [Physocladia obscura]
MALIISHKGHSYSIDVTESTSVFDIKKFLDQETGIPAENQKLLHKVLSSATNDDLIQVLLNKANIAPSDYSTQKILMIGSSAADVDMVKRKDNVLEIRKKRDETTKHKSTKIPEKPYRQFTFGSVVPLQGFADIDQAKKMLIRLREDLGIIEVMRKHKWFVETLTELHPAEKSILGFNKNMGQEISIRIRTDQLDGFRHYRTIVKVLLHELVHMVHSDHNEAFNTLNSQLNREYDSFSIARNVAGEIVDGSRVFSVDGDELTPVNFSGGGAFVLGGARTVNETNIERPNRDVLLKAAEHRLTQWEQDLIDSCNEHKQK